MNEYKYDYSKINSENFTQKDLMQYLLHSTQHSATREELQEVKSDLKIDIGEVKEEIKEVRTELKEVRTEIKEVRIELKADIDKLDNKFDKKFDRMQWFLVAGFLGILFKDYIIKIFQ